LYSGFNTFFKRPKAPPRTGERVLCIKPLNTNEILAVCCASRTKLLKIADQAIFYLANCQSSPDNRGFYDFFVEKIIKTYKCNRLLEKAAVRITDG
jgi:hypothetical protein